MADRVKVRIIGRRTRGTDPGDTVEVPAREARVLAALGRAEVVARPAAERKSDAPKPDAPEKPAAKRASRKAK